VEWFGAEAPHRTRTYRLLAYIVFNFQRARRVTDRDSASRISTDIRQPVLSPNNSPALTMSTTAPVYPSNLPMSSSFFYRLAEAPKDSLASPANSFPSQQVDEYTTFNHRCQAFCWRTNQQLNFRWSPLRAEKEFNRSNVLCQALSSTRPRQRREPVRKRRHILASKEARCNFLSVGVVGGSRGWLWLGPGRGWFSVGYTVWVCILGHSLCVQWIYMVWCCFCWCFVWISLAGCWGVGAGVSGMAV